VAQQLQRRGLNVVALEGGFNAWKALYEVEPLPALVSGA
jgi:rhodanese-related sulfurtransferase